MLKQWGKHKLPAMGNQEYIDGKYTVPYLSSVQVDDPQRSYVRSNMAETIVDEHCSFALDNFRYSTDNEDFKTWIKKHSQVDRELYRECLISGGAVELFSYGGGGKLDCTFYNPVDWAVERKDGKIDRAIYRKRKKEKIISFTEFTPTKINLYNSEGVPQSSTDHFFGQVPVNIYKLNKDCKSILSYATKRHIHSLSICLSSIEDIVKGDVRSPLVTTGLDFETLLKEDEDGITVWETMKRKGLIPIPEGASASYLEKKVNKDVLELAINRFEDLIRVSTKTPVLRDKTSNVEIRMAYAPFIGATKSHLSYFCKCLDRRIAFYNMVAAKLGGPTVNVTYDIDLQILHNNLEYLQNIANLAQVFTKEELLEILPFVDKEKFLHRQDKININEE